MAQALLKAKQRGVKVRIIADSKQVKMKSSKITYLINQGIPVKVLGGKEKGLMNHRFAILDGQRVITGSYDWSEASQRWNYDNILILKESEVVASYQREFDRLWCVYYICLPFHLLSYSGITSHKNLLDNP